MIQPEYYLDTHAIIEHSLYSIKIFTKYICIKDYDQIMQIKSIFFNLPHYFSLKGSVREKCN